MNNDGCLPLLALLVFVAAAICTLAYNWGLSDGCTYDCHAQGHTTGSVVGHTCTCMDAVLP